MSTTEHTRRKVGFVSLGCPKALVDSERIITELKLDGYDIVNSYDDADVVVVNTCGFIDSAKQESLEAVEEALAENGRVIVTGCLGKQSEELEDLRPDLIAVTGPHAYNDVINSVHEFVPPTPAHEPFLDLAPPSGIKLTPGHYAYLKISEGCNHKCSFCIIPSLRGKLVSRPIGEVMEEAERLANAGVKELLVISQDTSAYGVDMKYQTDLWKGRPLPTRMQSLCEALGELGIWVRLHYVYPYPHVDKVIPLMAQGKILPYLDIPFQHASRQVLKAMRRPAHAEDTLNRIRQWRQICPELTLRSTFIVGFPGETEADFEELLQFLREAQLDRVGCFAYSAVEGARANALPGAIDEDEKQRRLQRFMQVQADISSEKLQARIGQTMQVLVDALDDEHVLARSAADAPEIDGQVIFERQGDEQPGDFLQVEVHAASEHDLYATRTSN